MKMEYINTVNLGMIEDAFESGIMNTKDITKDFGCNLHLLLSHVKITYVVSELSILEAYIMKIFCNGDMVDLETSMDGNNINATKYPVTHRNIQSIFLLNKSIESDTDVTVKPGVLLFPAKCIEKKCIVSFQGQNLLTILGTLAKSPECFFIKVRIAMNKNPEKPKDEIIKELLFQKFFEEFYLFMRRKIRSYDLLTDSVLDFSYLAPARENNGELVSLAHINTIYGDIPFVNITDDMYIDSLDKIDKNKKDLDLVDSSFIANTSEIFFTCNATYYSFLESFIYLPLGSVLESNDIKVSYLSNQFIIPKEMAKYQARVSSMEDKMYLERKNTPILVTELTEDSEARKTKEDVDAANIIPLNTRTQYTLRFKLSEISDILLTWEEKIKNGMYGPENMYVVKEILKMIDLMKKYTIATYKTIVK